MEKYYWLNDDSITFLKRGYLQPGVEPIDRIKQIAATAEKILQIEGFAAKFEEYMSRGFYSLSTPVWMNYGLDRGLGISCFGITVQDTLPDIFRALGEIGTMTSQGGGTAGYVGNLRPRGSEISSGGASGGAVHFLEAFQSISSVVTQGAARRGHFAAYLPIDHADIEEFLSCRTEGHPIQTLSTAVTVKDYWMEEMINGDEEKRKIWAKVLQRRSETGYPFIFFHDNVNRQKPQAYKDKGLEINHSQMCVTGDQLIPTSEGIFTAYDLFKSGKSLTLFDNEKVVESSPMTLIEKNVPVYRITLDNGMTHTVTDYHKLKVAVTNEAGTVKYSPNGGYLYESKECKDLQIGDKVAIQTEKGLFGTSNYEKEAFLLGLYQSDGTQIDDSKIFAIWEKDWDLLPIVESYIKDLSVKYNYKPRYATKGERFIEANPGTSTVRRKLLTTRVFKDNLEFNKGDIPDWIFQSDEKTQWAYIKGYLCGDGAAYCCDKDKDLYAVEIVNTSLEFLRKFQVLLANLGLIPSLNHISEAGYRNLPDGKYGMKPYWCNATYRISVSNRRGLHEIEKNTSFLTRKGIDISTLPSNTHYRKTARIIDITPAGSEDVYCVKVDSPEHYWVCNGVVTHNCTEIMEYTDDLKSFTCCLSSLNLLHIDEILKTDAIETLTYFLDSVLTEFIEKASTKAYMEKAVLFAKEHRSIGLGVLGWHSYLQSKMIPFEGLQARFENIRIFKEINERSLQASKELAAKFGEPEVLKGYGERFSTRLAIAPTTSSSFILGQVSPSIEPLAGNYFLKDLAKGKFPWKNPFLQKLLSELGKDTTEVWKSISEKGGSVQHLSFLTDEQKSVFKTFSEVSQLEIIQQAAARQKYIDQAQSLNLMIHPQTPVRERNKLVIEAWKLGIKTLYYQRSANLAQQVSRDINNCVSCES